MTKKEINVWIIKRRRRRRREGWKNIQLYWTALLVSTGVQNHLIPTLIRNSSLAIDIKCQSSARVFFFVSSKGPAAGKWSWCHFLRVSFFLSFYFFSAHTHTHSPATFFFIFFCFLSINIYPFPLWISIYIICNAWNVMPINFKSHRRRRRCLDWRVEGRPVIYILVSSSVSIARNGRTFDPNWMTYRVARLFVFLLLRRKQNTADRQTSCQSGERCSVCAV